MVLCAYRVYLCWFSVWISCNFCFGFVPSPTTQWFQDFTVHHGLIHPFPPLFLTSSLIPFFSTFYSDQWQELRRRTADELDQDKEESSGKTSGDSDRLQHQSGGLTGCKCAHEAITLASVVGSGEIRQHVSLCILICSLDLCEKLFEWSSFVPYIRVQVWIIFLHGVSHLLYEP
jgi:hypothetical protein